MRSLDEALEDVGDFGYYQKRLYCFLLVTATFPVMQKWVWQLSATTPPHRCKFPMENTSFEDSWLMIHSDANRNVVLSIESEVDQMDSCSEYDINGSDIMRGSEELTYLNITQKCSNWVYYSDRRGIVREFNLVCDRSYFISLGEKIYIWAEILGFIFWGILSDRFGRKKIVFTACALQAIAGFFAGMVTSLSGVIAMRAALGLFGPGCYVGSILRMEFIGPSMRMVAAMIDCAAIASGQLLIAFFVYMLSNWRHLQILVSIPGFLYLSCWWFVPESARWLLAQKRERDGRKIVSKMALRNKRDLTIDTYESEEAECKAFVQSNPINLCCFSASRSRLLTLSFLWLVNSIGFYLISSKWMPQLNEDPLLHFVLNALIEMPAFIMCLFTLNRFGRRFPICVSMVATGILVDLSLAIPSDSTELHLVIVIFAKISSSATFASLYVFSMELQATIVRSAALGICASFRIIGQILFPFIELSSSLWEPLPYAIVSAATSVTGILVLFLPETTGYLMPERLEDVENPSGEDDDDMNVTPFSGRRVSMTMRNNPSPKEGKHVTIKETPTEILCS